MDGVILEDDEPGVDELRRQLVETKVALAAADFEKQEMMRELNEIRSLLVNSKVLLASADYERAELVGEVSRLKSKLAAATAGAADSTLMAAAAAAAVAAAASSKPRRSSGGRFGSKLRSLLRVKAAAADKKKKKAQRRLMGGFVSTASAETGSLPHTMSWTLGSAPMTRSRSSSSSSAASSASVDEILYLDDLDFAIPPPPPPASPKSAKSSPSPPPPPPPPPTRAHMAERQLRSEREEWERRQKQLMRALCASWAAPLQQAPICDAVFAYLQPSELMLARSVCKAWHVQLAPAEQPFWQPYVRAASADMCDEQRAVLWWHCLQARCPPGRYAELLAAAEAAEAQVAEEIAAASAAEDKGELDRLRAADIWATIDADLPRTYGRLTAQRARLEESSCTRMGKEERTAVLRRLLSAYSQLDSELGYCQGMNFMAALLLHWFDEEHAFWALHALLTTRDVRGLFLPGMPRACLCFTQLQQLLRVHLPTLASHLSAEAVEPSMWASAWLITLFSSLDTLPLSAVARVWDAFIVEGWAPIFAVLLAMMATLKEQLLQLDFAACVQTLHCLPDDTFADVDSLLARAQAIDVSL
eukprot:PLAT9053.6.p1 GENE.PLAT9053.6~~PLAT9053.6.p1  ORF type:complete len:600 (-),score=247.02 PLAT9053.6:108-1874(-)